VYGLTDTTDSTSTAAQLEAQRRKNAKTNEKRKLGTEARQEKQAVLSTPATPPVAPPPPPPKAQGIQGLLRSGNIDLNNRPIVRNPDGSISTVRSISVTDDQGHAILIPTFVGGKVVNDNAAIENFRQTGQNLGVFSSEDAANAYAETLHEQQAKQYLPKANQTPSAAAPPPAAVPPPPPKQPVPPVQNSTMDAAPQMGLPTSPVPHETSPTFTPAQYQPPKKGLEYLALGLGVLFPGAPIASLAAGAARGLQEGAQNSYQRREKEAEDQFKAQQAKAKTDFDNAQVTRQAEIDAQKVKFQNDTIRFEQEKEIRAQGIDPKTMQPFVVPPELQRILPPGTQRPVQTGDYVSHEAKLAEFYAKVGASDLATMHAKRADEYQKQVIDDANNSRALAIAMMSQEGQDRREATREQNANAREHSREASADRREAYRQGEADYRESVRQMHEDARAARDNPGKKSQLQDQSLRASKSFYSEWEKAIKPPTNPDGTPKVMKDKYGRPDPTRPLPAAISPQAAQQLSQAFIKIDRHSDPAGEAQYLADSITDPAQKQLLLARGLSADLTRRSKGLPIVPGSFEGMPKPPPPPPAPAAPPAAKHGSILDWIQGLMGHKPDAAPAAAAPSPEAPAAGVQTKVNPANGKTYYLHADGNYYLSPP
jgi:hypothetical protein